MMNGKMKRRSFVNEVGKLTIGLGALGISPGCFNDPAISKLQRFVRLPRSSPEEQGVSSSLISTFLNAVEESGLEFHSFMMLRNAHVIAEGWWRPFSPELKHTLYSLSKSFTSTAVGMAIDDQLLSLEDKVISFFPKDLPAEINEHLADMNVKHLLTMNTGHDDKPIVKMQEASDNNWVKAFLEYPVVHQPSTHFLYNTGASYMLSAIVQKVTNRTIHEYLSERLFPYLNITDADWELDANGICVGGYGLRVTTESIANFGQLYLQKGKWQDQRIISESWVKEATSKQTETSTGNSDWNQGYGYQFWRCKPQPSFYRGDGAFGQYCIVIPHENVVLAITSESSDMQKSMDLVWDYLLPAIGDNKIIESDYDDEKKLRNQLESLKLPILKKGTLPKSFANVNNRNYNLENNKDGIESFNLDFFPNHCTVHLKLENRTISIKCGFDDWIINDQQYPIEGSLFVIPNNLTSKVAACAGWSEDGLLLLKMKKIEGMHSDTWTCRFSGDLIGVNFMNSIHVLQNGKDERMSWSGRLI